MRDTEVDGLIEQGLAFHRRGQLGEARLRYEALLKLAPGHARAWHLLGIIALQSNQPTLALTPLARAVELDPANLAALKDYARTLMTLERFEAALAVYEKALSLSSDDAELHAGRGNAYFELRQFERAMESYDEALRGDPKFAGGHFNRAMALRELGDFGAALVGFEAAIGLDPNHARAHHFRGVTLLALKRREEALASFQAALKLRPDYADAYLNCGLALLELEAWEPALESFEAALQLAPKFPDAHNNRGNALYELGRVEEALASYERAVALGPTLPGLQFNRAQLLAETGRYQEAAAGFDRVLELSPAFEHAAGEALLARLKAGAWEDFGPKFNAFTACLARGEAAATPFALLALSDSAPIQRHAARAWIAKHVPQPQAAPRRQRRGERHVIGYFSPDFRDHPVARLAAPLFESHDRGRFEILAFSFGPASHDGWRERVAGGVDAFIEVARMPSRDIAALAREHGVDVAVDLAGLTKHSRPSIFAARAAAVQVSYLGYLGTLGAPFMDYLIADRRLVPETLRPHYDEKLAYLPGYHANDAAAPDFTKLPARASWGLPQDAFVFGCFNTPYKITPDTFARWMRILHRAPHALLMLQADESLAKRYAASAERSGVDPSRLVFGARLALDAYLRRFAALDLFLDTFPYNAGTTASDALLAGLPVLTLSGDTLASRVAQSALHAVGLEELVCESAEAYEHLAVAIAHDPKRLARLKGVLLQRRGNALVFDAKRFTSYLEQAFLRMIRRSEAGEAAEDFEIAP